MRFDDMLATVLARPAERPEDRVAQWRQLLDLLAQRRPGSDVELARRALARLQEIRGEVPVTIRQETARAFAGRPVPPPLVVFLAADVPPVAGALLGQVRLAEGDWLSVLPRLSPTARGFLRHRRDLGRAVEAALSGFGAADLSLPFANDVDIAAAPAEVAPPAEEQEPAALEPGAGEGQIRAIISRIERFRERREVIPAPRAETPVDMFRFETGADGVLCWADGAPRGALIGARLFDASLPAGAPLDGRTFHDIAFHVPGHSPVSGDWLLTGVPVFAARGGRFIGTRGVARRAPAVPEVEAGAHLGIRPDSLRQLVHELRTPLNAIGGFAEMIRRQMRGPISVDYRQRAELISEQAGRLLAAVDDLDVAARLEMQRLDLQQQEVDLATMLEAVCVHYAQVARQAGVALDHRAEPGLARAIGDAAALRRMLGRLIALATAAAEAGETLSARLIPSRQDELELSVTRPRRLDALDAATLLDPSFDLAGGGADAPPLGLGFALFLVRRLARAMGGALRIEADRFLLRFPAVSPALHAEAV